MSDGRWARLEEIFHAAAAMPPTARAPWLEQACGGDAGLRAEVERLLVAHDRAGAFIEVPALAHTDGLLEPPGASPMGQRFGPWVVVREIGRGGMGAVYLAERADGLYEQRVAIKLIKRGMDTDRLLARFRAERQILASLDHPNIARLLDGGTTDDGLPYLAMEYIEGEPIDRWAEAHAATVERRLELFLQVCGAVSYAHQRLVVHRDIKPLNILVTEAGVPKLLDFGIAKVLQPGEDDETSTVTGMRLLTPEYASPEQVEGRHATVASDVYSLGVVLYELLTGRSPYRTRGRTAAEMVAAVLTTDPERPSAVATRPGSADVELRLRRRLRGDLDTILLTALRKEPERRYASVEQFAEDVQRHLGGLPVRARPDTFRYRAGKFVRRNRVAVAAGSLAVLALVGGLLATAWQAREARAAQARAERQFNQLRKLANAVLFDYHDAIKDLRGSTPVRERLVRDALGYLDGLAREEQNDASLQRELAAAYRRVGDVQGGDPSGLGDTEGAITSYGKSLAILEALYRADSTDSRTRRDLASVSLALGALVWERGDPDGGRARALRARDILRPLVAAFPDSTGLRLQYGGALDLLGQIALDMGDGKASAEYLRANLAQLDSLPEGERARPDVRRAISRSWGYLGDAQDDLGDLTGALESHRRSLAIREALARQFPDNADYARLVSTARYYVALTLSELGRWSEALPLFRANIADDPAAFSLLRVGDALVALGRPAEALGQFRAALQVHEAELRADSANLYKRLAVAEDRSKVCYTLGVLRRADARAECDRAEAFMASTPIASDNAFPRALFGRYALLVGEGYEASGNRAMALALYRRGDTIWTDLKARGMLSRQDAAQPDSAARHVARLEAMLQGRTVRTTRP